MILNTEETVAPARLRPTGVDAVDMTVEGIPDGVRSNAFVAQGIEAIRSLEVAEKQARLERLVNLGQRKPYLHAVEDNKLADLSYDSVLQELDLSTDIGALYLHFPFCTKKCRYCHYYKQVNAEPAVVEAYDTTLVRELRLLLQAKGQTKKLRAKTVHLGGGTPSLMSTPQLERMLRELDTVVNLSACDELAFEADPENVDAKRAREWSQLGINRVSLGVQSFDGDVLKHLRRQHDKARAIEAIEAIQEAGIVNLNVDIMYSMPTRTWESLCADIDVVRTVKPESVTFYATRPDPRDSVGTNAAFPTVTERLVASSVVTSAMLNEGFIQFSPNQFIRSYGGACLAKSERNRSHNVLGAGPHAHSIIQRWFYKNFAGADSHRANIEAGKFSPLIGHRMSLDEEMVRFMQFGIKMSGINKPDDDNGILVEEYERAFDQTVDERFSWHLRQLTELNLVENRGRNIALTEAGLPLANRVVDFLAMPAH